MLTALFCVLMMVAMMWMMVGMPAMHAWHRQSAEKPQETPPET